MDASCTIQDSIQLRRLTIVNVSRILGTYQCYMHSPEPLSAKELLKVMPTDESIAEIYKRLSPQKKIESSIPTWGDAIVWSELHRTIPYPELWS